MNLEKIPLKTVRQFFIQDVALANFEDQFTPDTPQVVKKVENLCYAKVQLLKRQSYTILFYLFFFFLYQQPSISSPFPLRLSAGHRDAGGG